MNWLDLLTQFDWQKIATGAIGLFVLWYERKWLKDSAVGAGKKVAGVFKAKVKEATATDPVEVFGHLMHVREAVKDNAKAVQCVKYLASLLTEGK